MRRCHRSYFVQVKLTTTNIVNETVGCSKGLILLMRRFVLTFRIFVRYEIIRLVRLTTSFLSVNKLIINRNHQRNRSGLNTLPNEHIANWNLLISTGSRFAETVLFKMSHQHGTPNFRILYLINFLRNSCLF